ncbi:hypothetical protein FH972_004813 [Carpinus fangiana]|uniref:Protein kinase domain-containing protein n=1 Tax=Carpinus fangiana TaxID=176857 RepID=A0A5N6QMC5_9ROSI|nr:hypothetical protein FH972_004813 [Carpinus fangiana]
MACYIFKIKHFPFPKPLILFYLLTITSFFSEPSPFTSALNFNFPNFISGNSSIKYDRNAFVKDSVIQITGDRAIPKAVGRATYFEPMHLWDKASRNLTDFTTNFTFVIDSQDNTHYGDGLAFFLAPSGSISIPPNVSEGGAMGLTNDHEPLNSTNNPFVAVEFDIFSNSPNGWDPPGEHVGIDINSMLSKATKSWNGSRTLIMEGKINEARISYNSTSHNLSVLFTGLENNATVWQSLSYNLDLRVHLPEYVTFGFSAATGSSSAIYKIHTWDFRSSLEDVVTNQRKKNNLGLAIGLGVGGPFLVAGLALILLGLWKKRNRRRTDEELALDRCMDEEFQKGIGPKRFSFNELARATNNFSDEEKLGQGGFGGVYKGFLRDSNTFVAVKRVSKGSKQGIKEYASEPNALEDQVVMVEWVRELYGMGKILEAADPKLGRDFDEQQMERLMIVGLWCAHPDHNVRPSIRQTIHVLNFEAPLPVLPSNMSGSPQLSATMKRHAMSLLKPNVATQYEGGHNQYTSNSYTNSSLSTSSSTASPSASLLHTSLELLPGLLEGLEHDAGVRKVIRTLRPIQYQLSNPRVG